MKKILTLIMALTYILAQSSFAASEITPSMIERHLLEGKYNMAISESEALIDSGAGRKEELYYLKGLSELKASRFQDARESFSYIIAHYPRSKKLFDARLGVGDSYLLGGDNAKALSVYNDMAAVYSSDKNIAIVHARLGACHARMGESAKADSYYGMVKAKAPLGFEAISSRETVSTVRNPAPGRTASRTAEEPAYSVQAGSFNSKKNADRLARKLSLRGYDSYVSIPVSSRDKFYRVRVGRFASRDEAVKVASRLESDGYRARICSSGACE